MDTQHQQARFLEGVRELVTEDPKAHSDFNSADAWTQWLIDTGELDPGDTEAIREIEKEWWSIVHGGV